MVSGFDLQRTKIYFRKEQMCLRIPSIRYKSSHSCLFCQEFLKTVFSLNVILVLIIFFCYLPQIYLNLNLILISSSFIVYLLYFFPHILKLCNMLFFMFLNSCFKSSVVCFLIIFNFLLTRGNSLLSMALMGSSNNCYGLS